MHVTPALWACCSLCFNGNLGLFFGKGLWLHAHSDLCVSVLLCACQCVLISRSTMGLDRELLAKQERENFLTLSSQLTVENRVL